MKGFRHPWVEETLKLEEGSVRRDQERAGLMEWEQDRASRTLLKRILDLHAAGRPSDEIAAQVLTSEPENAMFRAAMLVEIILQYTRRCPKEKNQ